MALLTSYLCNHCGHILHGKNATCPNCEDAPPPPRQRSVTQPLRRRPNAVASERKGTERFDLHTSVLLQFFPSGVCYTLLLTSPVVLGRGSAPNANSLDTSELGAHRHGVSRQHCPLWRRGKHLVVTDLNSVNGTYLNGQLLRPHEEYLVADGDQLILGTLHATIFFNRHSDNGHNPSR